MHGGRIEKGPPTYMCEAADELVYRRYAAETHAVIRLIHKQSFFCLFVSNKARHTHTLGLGIFRTKANHSTSVVISSQSKISTAFMIDTIHRDCSSQSLIRLFTGLILYSCQQLSLDSTAPTAVHDKTIHRDF